MFDSRRSKLRAPIQTESKQLRARGLANGDADYELW
jgi:hypothetical protein